MKLQDAVIAITGAAQGLGKTIALSLAGKGCHLALIDMNPDALEEVEKQCLALQVKAKSYVCNVADEEAVISTFDQIVTDFGALNALVNNAGILRDSLLIKSKDGKAERRMSLSQWQAVIDVNLTGVFLCGREAGVKMMESASEGCIVNISSISRAGNIGQSNYSAAKAGVAAMTVTWAKELARHNVRSMAIAPGFIETDMTASMPAEALEKATRHIPLGRMGQPEHIAQTVAFILENDYLTGRVIEVDGGLRI